MSKVTLLIWIYTALLLVGGVMGMVKAGSKISLISAVVFAIPLALVALGHLPFIVAQVDVGFLVVVFGMRYAKTKKVMPAGMMAVVSVITLGLLFWLSKAS